MTVRTLLDSLPSLDPNLPVYGNCNPIVAVYTTCDRIVNMDQIPSGVGLVSVFDAKNTMTVNALCLNLLQYHDDHLPVFLNTRLVIGITEENDGSPFIDLNTREVSTISENDSVAQVHIEDDDAWVLRRMHERNLG